MPVLVTVGSIDFTFNFDTQVIDVESSVSSLDVYDLWVAIRTAAGSDVGITYPVIARASGLDELDSAQGISTFITVTLFDNWEVNSLKVGGKFTLTGGNLLRLDGEDPFLDNPAITYFAFFSQAGTLTTVTTGSGVTEQDKQDIAGLINPNIDDVQASTDAIKNKTDQIIFTNAGEVDANTKSMNNSEVLGSGTSADKWRGE